MKSKLNVQIDNSAVATACRKIKGFKNLYKRLEQKIIINGFSQSTLICYGIHIAYVALYYKTLPTKLNQDQIEEYLFYLKKNRSVSISYYNLTISSLRYLYRIEDLEEKIIFLPANKITYKLPTVLSKEEIKSLIIASPTLKHRVLIAVIYGCGLRRNECRLLQLRDIDFERGVIRIRQSKGYKDRYVPIGKYLRKELKKYLRTVNPIKWLFNGRDYKQPYRELGINWVVQEAVKKTAIKKKVSVHTLRHTYAIHLLEDGLDLVTIKNLLGHIYIGTTMKYLKIVNLGRHAAFSPLDSIY